MKIQYVITNQDHEMVHSTRFSLHSSVVAWTTLPDFAKRYSSHSQAFREAVKLDRGKHCIYVTSFEETETQYIVGRESCSLAQYPSFFLSLRPST